jgi:hypothetical protein
MKREVRASRAAAKTSVSQVARATRLAVVSLCLLDVNGTVKAGLQFTVSLIRYGLNTIIAPRILSLVNRPELELIANCPGNKIL